MSTGPTPLLRSVQGTRRRHKVAAGRAPGSGRVDGPSNRGLLGTASTAVPAADALSTTNNSGGSEHTRRRRRIVLSNATATNGPIGSNSRASSGRQRMAGYLLVALALALLVCFATLYNRLKDMEALIVPLTSEKLYRNVQQ